MKKRKLTDNIPLKIMSLLVGFLVWLIVVNIDNPVTTISMAIPESNIEVINKAYIDNADTGMMCLQENSQDLIRISVTGERKTLDKIRSSDIHAVADLQQAVSLSTNPVMVPITVSYPGIQPGNIKVTPQYLGVKLEEKLTQEFPVNAVYGDGRPGKGYEVGSQTVSPEKIKITGPKSLINKIDKVNVNVSISGKTKDITEEKTISIIDKNQDPLTEGRMANLTIDNGGKVTVTTKFWRVRSDVNINAQYTGEPAYGYQVDSVTTIPENISVAGTEEALELLRAQGNTLLISGEELDISGEKGDIEKKISLTDILPENLKLTSGSSEDVWVRIVILPEDSHAYNVATSKIKVKNQPNNLQVTFETDKIEIRVKAKEGSLEDFDAEAVEATIDLEDKKEGSYDVPVKIMLPEGYELLKGVTTGVQISAVSSAGENNKSKG